MEHCKKFLIIEDHYIVAWALKSLIESAYGNAVVETATTFDKGLEQLSTMPVDLVILDIGLPDGQSVDMIGKLRSSQPQVKILIYSGLPEVEHAATFLSAGASGFVAKDQPMETVNYAIQIVLEGKKYVSKLTCEVITGAFLNGSSRNIPTTAPVYLTPRECDVILLMLKGKWTKEIAIQLGLRVTTVSTHKTHIMEKFGVENSIDLFKAVQVQMPHLIQGEGSC